MNIFNEKREPTCHARLRFVFSKGEEGKAVARLARVHGRRRVGVGGSRRCIFSSAGRHVARFNKDQRSTPTDALLKYYV